MTLRISRRHRLVISAALSALVMGLSTAGAMAREVQPGDDRGGRPGHHLREPGDDHGHHRGNHS